MMLLGLLHDLGKFGEYIQLMALQTEFHLNERAGLRLKEQPFGQVIHSFSRNRKFLIGNMMDPNIYVWNFGEKKCTFCYKPIQGNMSGVFPLAHTLHVDETHLRGELNKTHSKTILLSKHYRLKHLRMELNIYALYDGIVHRSSMYELK